VLTYAVIHVIQGGAIMVVRFVGTRKRPLATEIRIKNALEQMKARGVNDDYCPRCEKFDWNVDLLEIPVNSAMSGLTGAVSLGPGSQTIPVNSWLQTTGALQVLSIVCKICGYTIFHTLNVLESQER
jgi:hypothetical protein